MNKPPSAVVLASTPKGNSSSYRSVTKIDNGWVTRESNGDKHTEKFTPGHPDAPAMPEPECNTLGCAIDHCNK